MRPIVAGVAVVAAGESTGCMVGPTRSETEAGFGSTAPISMAALPEATVADWNAQDRSRPSSATNTTSTSAGQKSREFEPETGFFVGLSAVYTQIGGDFDGNTAFTATDGVTTVDAVVPDLDPGYGGRIAAGYRWKWAAVEASFERSQLDGSDVLGDSFDAVYSSFDLDGRLFLPSPSPRLKPSVIGGVALPFLDVEDGAVQTDGFGNATSKDSRFTGLGFDLGVGLDFYVTPHWSIDFLALYRWNRFDHLEAGAFDDDLPSDLSGDGLVLGLGTSWTF
jgi:opacity protein-like surface antigen